MSNTVKDKLQAGERTENNVGLVHYLPMVNTKHGGDLLYLELLNFSMLKPIVGTISCVCVCPPTRGPQEKTSDDKRVKREKVRAKVTPFTWLTCFHSSENGPKRLDGWKQAASNESETASCDDPSQYTHIRRFELVDDGGFAAVVKPQTQNVDLLLPQAEPGR